MVTISRVYTNDFKELKNSGNLSLIISITSLIVSILSLVLVFVLK